MATASQRARQTWGDGEQGPAPVMPPYSQEAEEAVLGSCFISRDAIRVVRGWLKPDDFYRGKYRDIYEAMIRLADRGEPTDVVLVGTELGDAKRDEIGGWSELSRLSNYVPQSGHIEHYGRKVQDLAILRRLDEAVQVITSMVYEPGARGADVLPAALDLVRRAGQRAGIHDSVPADQAIRNWLEGVYTTMDTGPRGLLTGFGKLDDLTKGFLPTEQWIVTAPTSGGKSVWALSVALHMAKKQMALAAEGKSCGAVEYITLEMSATQQVQRMLAAWTGTNSRSLRADFWEDGRFNGDLFADVERGALELADLVRGYLRFYDQPMRLSQLEAHIERAVDERGCPAVILDYITLVDPENARADDRQKVNLLTWRMKQIAMRCRIPVICLMQMNRNFDGRENKRPQLTDLKNSSDAEQNADGVIGIHLPYLYEPARAASDPDFSRFGELWVLKARGSVRDAWAPFSYEGEYTRCSNWPRGLEIPADPTRPGSKAQEQK